VRGGGKRSRVAIDSKARERGGLDPNSKKIPTLYGPDFFITAGAITV
jgi:hypothetical protein